MDRAVAMSIFVIAFALQACATPPYVQPEGADVAVLRIRNDVDRRVEVKAFKNAADCSGGKLSVTSDGWMPAFGELAINVKPGEPFSFFVIYVAPSGLVTVSCMLPATFTPRPNGRYTARFSVSASDRKCYLPLVVQTTSGEQPEPSFRLRQWQTPVWSGSESFCK